MKSVLLQLKEDATRSGLELLNSIDPSPVSLWASRLLDLTPCLPDAFGDARWTDFAGMGLILAGLAVALLGRGANLRSVCPLMVAEWHSLGFLGQVAGKCSMCMSPVRP